MIENRPDTLAQFISPFVMKTRTKVRVDGQMLDVSHGMSEAGYDIRLAEATRLYAGCSVLGCTLERVEMPDNMTARVIGKSTWARLGIHLNVTEIDPGFIGYVTLELSYMPRHTGWLPLWRKMTLSLPGGVGIGCLQFVYVSQPVRYSGKYQDQPAKPIDAR